MYGHPDNVELYTAQFAEMPASKGAVLTNTAAFMLLSDAFSSVLQDRFHTEMFNPEGYTPWGFDHVNSTNFVDLINLHLKGALPQPLDRRMWLTKRPGAMSLGWCLGSKVCVCVCV